MEHRYVAGNQSDPLVLDSASENETDSPPANLGSKRKRISKVIVLDDSEDEFPRMRRKHRDMGGQLESVSDQSTVQPLFGSWGEVSSAKIGTSNHRMKNPQTMHRPPQHELALDPTSQNMQNHHLGQDTTLTPHGQHSASDLAASHFQFHDPTTEDQSIPTPLSPASQVSWSDQVAHQSLNTLGNGFNQLEAIFPQDLNSLLPASAFLNQEQMGNQQSVGASDSNDGLAPSFDDVLRLVVEVFPKICPEHVHTLYDEHLRSSLRMDGFVQEVISRITDEGDKYPRRKPGPTTNLQEDKDKPWTVEKREPCSKGDRILARSILQQDFRDVPLKFIDDKLDEHPNLYPAYLEIDKFRADYDEMPIRPYEKLKKLRPSRPDVSEASTNEGRMGQELDDARNKASEYRETRRKKKQKAEEDKARDDADMASGNHLECGCCFNDVPMSKTVHCEGDELHFFCYSCLQETAKTQLELQKHKILCMDVSGCQAEFSRKAKKDALDAQTFERLARIEQQADLRDAQLSDLVQCPFCDYAAIPPPIDEDKEFRCEAPNCGEVSCRLCKLKSHTPKTCEENKKDSGIEERHYIEEQMTAAAIRRCPNPACGIAITKTSGCNKVECSQCRTKFCDVCNKDITREGYHHFGPGKCQQNDVGWMGKREDQRIKAAEVAAKAKIRAQNPDISDADLEIKFSKAVDSASQGAPMSRDDRMNQVAQMLRRNGQLGQGYMPPMHVAFNNAPINVAPLDYARPYGFGLANVVDWDPYMMAGNHGPHGTGFGIQPERFGIPQPIPIPARANGHIGHRATAVAPGEQIARDLAAANRLQQIGQQPAQQALQYPGFFDPPNNGMLAAPQQNHQDAMLHNYNRMRRQADLARGIQEQINRRHDYH